MDDTTEKKSFWTRPIDRREMITKTGRAVVGAAAVTALPDIARAKEQQRIIRQRVVGEENLNDFGIILRSLRDKVNIIQSQEIGTQTEPVVVSELVDKEGERAGFCLRIPVAALAGGDGMGISFNKANDPSATRQFDTSELSVLATKPDGTNQQGIDIYCLDSDYSAQIAGTKTDTLTMGALLLNVVVAEGGFADISKVTIAVNCREFTQDDQGRLTVKVTPVRFYAGILDQAIEDQGKANFVPTSAQG